MSSYCYDCSPNNAHTRETWPDGHNYADWSRRRGIKVNTFITIIGQTISVASTQTTYSDHHGPTQDRRGCGFFAAKHPGLSDFLHCPSACPRSIHFHIELFGSEHESHVEHQRHSVTTKQGIHVPPISMPVIGRISGKADKPPAVYLALSFHEGVFRTDKQRHIVIGEFRLCRNCYPATVLRYKRTFRTDHRQGERCSING